MKNIQFPIFKTKIKGLEKKFNFLNPQEEREYFQAKAGKEIRQLRDYLENHTFIAYLLGKKNAGKGTYSQMFGRIVAPGKIKHLSVGDMIRDVDKELKDEEKRGELFRFLEKNYRGRKSLEEIIESLEKRSTKTLLPTELILTLLKREISLEKKRTLFIDGFPRDLDQVSFSLFFRDLIGYRDDRDVFILIDLPESVIDERIRWRRICPICHKSRNLKLLPTPEVGYDTQKKEFYLMCDNPSCHKVRMVKKEGDELGVQPIKARLEQDEVLMQEAFSLYGIPKVLLRNSIPVEKAKEFVDDYEITPEYVFHWQEKENKVEVEEKPFIVKDDNGIPSYSLLAQPVVVSLIKQLAKILAP